MMTKISYGDYPHALGLHSELVKKTAKEAPSTLNARAETRSNLRPSGNSGGVWSDQDRP
jgi:hypothetical protein